MTSPQALVDDEKLVERLERTKRDIDSGLIWKMLLGNKGEWAARDYGDAIARLQSLSAEVARLRAALKPAEIGLTDLVKWLGPCEHEIGLCHCEVRAARDEIRTALAEQERQ